MTVQNPVIMLPSQLAAAIEWVLRPSRDRDANPLPDLSRLTSAQMELLPLPVAQDFTALVLAVKGRQPSPRRPTETPRPTQHTPRPSPDRLPTPGAAETPYGWAGQLSRHFEPGRTPQARAERQRAQALRAAHTRLLVWYLQTGNAQHRGFTQPT